MKKPAKLGKLSVKAPAKAQTEPAPKEAVAKPAKPVLSKFVPQPRPGFTPDKGGKHPNGPMTKGRMFRHQGR